MTTIAVIGAGNMGAVHAGAYAQLTAPVAALADLDAAAQQVARRFGAQFFTDAEAMIRTIRPDVVDICTPTHTHRALTELAAAYGCHVIVEKPMARTAADAAAMAAACQRAGVRLLAGHVTRFYPEYQAVRERLLAGAVGTPQNVRLFRQSDRPPAAWMADVALSGGVILDLMIHDFDWVQWALGPVTRVFCRATPAFDQAHALLELASGATVLVEGSWLHPDGFAAGLTVRGYGDSLSMACRGPASPLHMHVRGRPAVAENPLARTPHTRQLEHFLAVLRGEAECLIAPEEAVSAVRVAEAALRSAQTGRAVSPEEVAMC